MGTVFLAGVAAAAAVTWLVWRVAGRAGVLDHPGDRSSHDAPTPTMGGLGLVGGFWAGLGMAALLGWSDPWTWPVYALCSAVSLVFVWDEIRPMGRLPKLVVQSVAAVAPISFGLVLDVMPLPFLPDVELGAAAYPVTFLWLVGIQNVYNFMDGIDSIAGLEGFIVAGFAASVAAAYAPVHVVAPLACAGAAAGFLVWNRPPARVFMGDVGSHFLGLLFGVLALVLYDRGLPFVTVPLALGVFLYDTGYTVIRRALRGENITLAHRFHLYQRLADVGWSHARIDAAYGCLTVLLCIGAYSHAAGQADQAAAAVGVAACVMIVGTIWIERAWGRTKPGAHAPG